LQAKVLVLSGQPARALPIVTELLPQTPGASDDQDDSVAEATYGEALLRTNPKRAPEALTHLRAALAMDAKEATWTPARLEEIADTKLLVAEAMLAAGGNPADAKAALDAVPAAQLSAPRAAELRAIRAHGDGETAAAAR
jgi:hypothetical protein